MYIIMVLRFVFAMMFTLRHHRSVGQHSPQQPLYNVSFPDQLSANNFTSDSIIDVQYASCKIITDRIVATAEGKFSRFCHGICNINETNAKLHRIETLLTTEVENIKNRLINLERILFNVYDISKTDGSVGGDKERFLTAAAAIGDTGRLREIGTYNGTVFTTKLTDGGTAWTVFVYYWRVDAFWRLTFSGGRARSTPFYVSPRSYRIALTVHSDPATQTVRVAAVLATGEYDAQLRWPFPHQLRLSVLDQTDVTPEDIVSSVWDDVRCGNPLPPSPQQKRFDSETQCVTMEFQHDVLTYRRHVANDSLIIKLTVFLRQF